MKTKLLLAILLVLSVFRSFAQDVIIKKNGDEISAKVLEVSDLEIKYKRADNMEGPTYAIFKSDVFMIKYSNGTKMVVSSVDAVDTMAEKRKAASAKNYFREGKSYISVGYGFGVYANYYSSSGFYGSGHSGYGSLGNHDGTPTGPFYLKYEYAVTEEWSIGVNLSYVEDKFVYNYDSYVYNSGTPVMLTETSLFTSFSGLFHANWHFANMEKVDPYFGFGVGYRSGNWDYTTNDPSYTSTHSSTDFPFGFETTIGIRIKIVKSLSAYTEVGIAKSVIQFGITAGL